MNKPILIAKNVQLTSRLKAKEIWVDSSANITIIADQFGPYQEMPYMSLDYFDSLCSRFYYSNYTHKHAIADILLLNGLISKHQYEDFYDNLRDTLEASRFTMVYSELFQ